MAGYDPTQYEAIAARDLREVLLGYEALMRDRILAANRHEQTLFALGATGKHPPQLPDWIRLYT